MFPWLLSHLENVPPHFLLSSLETADILTFGLEMLTGPSDVPAKPGRGK